ADQKRIAEAERQAKNAAEDTARLSEAARVAAEVAQRKLRNRWRLAVASATVALLAFMVSLHEGLESQRYLHLAHRAFATAILADLDLKPETSLTARQRNALWKLTTADDAVRVEFVSALSASPVDLIRIAAGFDEVSRSLGLQWPSLAGANKLFATAIVAISK